MTETSGIQIRRCQPDEAASLTEIAHRSKRHWGYPESCIVSWSDQLTVTAEFIGAQEVHAAVDASQQIAGFYALIDRGDGLTELEHFWVLPERMGHGVGRRLLDHAVQTARQHGGQAIKIASDPHAAGFYRRLGARPIGRQSAPIDGEPGRFLPLLLLELAA